MAKSTDEKPADLIRRLGTNHDGEIVATVHALKRVLKAAGRDLHKLADGVAKNGSGLSETEMRKLYDAGFEAGLQEGESRHEVATTFRNVDSAAWHDMARSCPGSMR
jgi:hypothetical protein